MKTRPPAAVVLSLLLWLPAACGGGGNKATAPSPAADTPSAPAQRAAPPPAAAARAEPQSGDWSGPGAAAAGAGDVRLATVQLRPQRVYADSALEVAVTTRPAQMGERSLRVRFWINGEEVQDSAGTILPPGRLKKGDGVFADVFLMQGEVVRDRRRTDLVLVENSDPRIDDVVFPEIKGPGRYVITVKAEDPDDDALTLELDGVDLPDWLTADPSGNRIVLEPGDDPPPRLEFEVVVRDDDGGEARRKVTLTFRRPAQENAAPAEEGE